MRYARRLAKDVSLAAAKTPLPRYVVCVEEGLIALRSPAV